MIGQVDRRLKDPDMIKFLFQMFRTKPVEEVQEYFSNLLNAPGTDYGKLQLAWEAHYLLPLSAHRRPVVVWFVGQMLDRLGVPSAVVHLSPARHIVASGLRKLLAAEKGIVTGSMVMCKGKGPYLVLKVDDQGLIRAKGFVGGNVHPANVEVVPL